MEENPFDQFDEVTSEANPFDQFDNTDSVENLPATPNSVAERAATLPLPRPNMFADMGDDEAKIAYDAYSCHPETQRGEDGSLIYRGEVVPAPEGNSGFVDFMAGVGQRVFSGMSPAAAEAKREVTGDNPDELYMSEKIGRGIGGGAVNLGRNIVETGVGLATSFPLIDLYEGATGQEVIPEAVTNARSGIATAVEDTLPKFNPKGIVEA